MAEVIEAYRTVTASEELQELERMRQKAMLREAAALRNERVEMAKNFKTIGTDIDIIAQATGLPVEEVRGL